MCVNAFFWKSGIWQHSHNKPSLSFENLIFLSRTRYFNTFSSKESEIFEKFLLDGFFSRERIRSSGLLKFRSEFRQNKNFTSSNL